MPNDFLSSPSIARSVSAGRLVEGRVIAGGEPSRRKEPSTPATSQPGRARVAQRPVRRAFAAFLPLLASVVLLAVGGCGSEDEGLTYARNVRPIFGQRCAICHRADGPSGVDIQNPYASVEGLVNSANRFKQLHPELNLPAQNVVPGEPENSFLMYKIDDSLPLPPDPDATPTSNGPLEPPAGKRMPLQIPELDCEQVHIIEQWVMAGAPQGQVPFADPGAPARPIVPATDETLAIPACAAIPAAMRSFSSDIEPIFGTEQDLDRTLNTEGGVCTPGAGKPCPRCIYCHYQGSQTPPDLTDVFNPVTGLVNAPARYRGNMMRVAPGDLENSLLIQKLHYERFTTGFARSDYGAKMPYSFDPLSRTQIETVRQWILEGAKP
jgi:hypothetical protein